MAEVSKSRLALDLEEIERQLSHSSPQPGSHRSDPLAELARIVGQDDPFRALLAGDNPSSPGHVSSTDIFARREPLFQSPGYPAFGQSGNGLRGSLQDDETVYPDHASILTAEEEAILRGQQDPRYAPEPDGADSYYRDGSGYAAEDSYAPVAPRRSRKGMVAIGAVLGAAVLGSVGALALRPVSLTGSSGGEPPVVKAETGPSKVAPLNPGGVDIPNQNKQIYERATQDSQTRVVNREEQPVDVRQAARTGGALTEGPAGSAPVRMSPAIPPGMSTNAIPSSLQGAGTSATGVLGEPRRVRTVSIRPDGTIAMPDQGGNNGRPAAPPPMVMPRADAQVAPAALAPATPASGSMAPAGAGSQPPQVRMVPPQRPRDVTATPVAPRPGPSTTEQPIGAPMQITSEAVRPKNDPRMAAAPQATLREPTETAAAPTASPGFSVQLGVRNTEREARTVFEQLQQRYASDLSGYPPSIRQAEINGKTAYRVRVGPMSRDDAASLCSRLKTSGGQCFVANN